MSVIVCPTVLTCRSDSSIFIPCRPKSCWHVSSTPGSGCSSVFVFRSIDRRHPRTWLIQMSSGRGERCNRPIAWSRTGEHLVSALCISARTPILQDGLRSHRSGNAITLQCCNGVCMYFNRLLTRIRDNFFGDLTRCDQFSQHAKLPRQEERASVLR